MLDPDDAIDFHPSQEDLLKEARNRPAGLDFDRQSKEIHDMAWALAKFGRDPRYLSASTCGMSLRQIKATSSKRRWTKTSFSKRSRTVRDMILRKARTGASLRHKMEMICYESFPVLIIVGKFAITINRIFFFFSIIMPSTIMLTGFLLLHWV